MFEWFKRSEAPKTDEVAVGSLIYGADHFEKYNPDSLVGMKGLLTYKKMSLDEQVKAAAKFRRDAITSRDYTFEMSPASREKLGEEEAERRVDLFTALTDLAPGTVIDGLNRILSATVYGFSLVEKIYHPIEVQGKTYWGIKALKLRPADTFTFKVDKYDNLLKVIQRTSTGEEVEIDPIRFIHFVQNPDIDPHYGQSDLREAYRPWFSKDVVIKLHNMWLERHAGGMRWLQMKEGKTLTVGSPNYTAAQKFLNDIQAGVSMGILPADMTMNQDYPSGAVPFDGAIDKYDLQIARALLVPNLLGVTPAGQTGSYSQSDRQLEAFLWTITTDATRLQDAVNEQLFSELGWYNFGDEHYPRMVFKAVSEEKQHDLVRLWKELVKDGAVSRTQSDEDYIREVLEIPARLEEDTSAGASQSSALNGAQVASLVSILEKVATGVLPKESAVATIVACYPIDEDKAQGMVETIEVKEPTPPPVSSPPGEEIPAAEGDPMADEESDEENDEEGAGAPVLETIAGYLWSQYSKEQVMGRVSFKVIDKTSEDDVGNGVAEVSAVMDEIAATLIEQVDAGAGAKDLAIESKLKRRLKTAAASALRRFWRLGELHAKTEIDTAKKDTFSAKFDRARMATSLNDFIDIESFTMSGKFSDDILNKTREIIKNGLQKDKTSAVIKEEIYTMFAREGLVSQSFALDALGDALGDLIADSRLTTAIRTTGFKAINEARFSYFTDPGLESFVQGFEYSAILDSRTTEICQHLDGQQHPADDAVWESYNPPNHFNCRSLLIPITLVDKLDPSEPPTIDPQEGFA